MSEEQEFVQEILTWEKNMRVANRIVCEELGYPESEALFGSIREWENAHGMNWIDFLCDDIQKQIDELGA